MGLKGYANILQMSEDDIRAQAEENGIKLTKEQVVEAFDIAVDNADNECLMNAFWANIDYAIDEVTKNE